MPAWLRQLVSAAVMALMLAGAIAHAEVEERGARFDQEVTLGGDTLVLTGTGIARYRVIFVVYAAGLYVPPDTATSEVLAADTPRRLEIEYFYDISAEDIILAANTKLEEQLTADQLASLEPDIATFHGYFQSVSEGDRYRMEYQPGQGTELIFNGEPVGTMPGAEFAEAYFGVWLDPDSPLSGSLRDDLLEGTR